MPKQTKPDTDKAQVEAFRQIAKSLECDEDAKKFDKTLSKMAKRKPSQTNPQKK